MIKLHVFRERTIFNQFTLFRETENYNQLCPAYCRALKLSKQNKTSQAIKLMNSLVKSNPNNDINRQLYANILLRKCEDLKQQAIKQRKIAYQLNPSILNICSYAATLSTNVKSIPKARSLFKHALKNAEPIKCAEAESASIDQILSTSNAIHLALACSYVSISPFNLKKAWKHCKRAVTNEPYRKYITHPIVYAKTLLLLGKFSMALGYVEKIEHQFDKGVRATTDPSAKFEIKKVYAYLLLYMERYNDAINKFLDAKLNVVIKEQILECCTGLTLCYSHLNEFDTAEQWFKKGDSLLRQDKRNQILRQVGVQLFCAYNFLWYKKKLYQNNKKRRQFSPKLEPLPFALPFSDIADFHRQKFGPDIIKSTSWYCSNFLVHGLHAQYNDGLLVEAIVAYYMFLDFYPAAIAYWHISIAFCELKYYAMSLKGLKRAWKISPEIPTIEHGYLHKRQFVESVCNKYKCNYCGHTEKLRACMGCCNVFYCSKYCQKRDWKYKHRIYCDKKFGIIIKAIKDCGTKWSFYRKQLLKYFPKHISRNFAVCKRKIP
eukprot:391732_1